LTFCGLFIEAALTFCDLFIEAALTFCDLFIEAALTFCDLFIEAALTFRGVQSFDPPILAFPLRGKEIKARACVLISFPRRGKARMGGSKLCTPQAESKQY